jgi:hypothetical protein
MRPTSAWEPSLLLLCTHYVLLASIIVQIFKEWEGCFGGWFEPSGLRAGAVAVVVFHRLGWMDGTARRRGIVVSGQFRRRFCLQFLDHRLNDGCLLGAWCFRMLFAHGTPPFCLRF